MSNRRNLEEITIRATRIQIEEFTESLLWKDFQQECEAWLHGFDIELNSIVDEAATTNPSSATVLMHMGEINGRKKAINYLLQLPDMFLDILNEKAELEKMQESKNEPEEVSDGV